MLGQAREEAKVRQVAGLMKGGVNPRCGHLATTGKQPSISHRARDEIAEAVGMATTTLRRAQDVVKRIQPSHAPAYVLGFVVAVSVVEHPPDRQNLLAQNMQYIEEHILCQ